MFFDKYYNIEYTRTWKKPLKNRSFFFLAYSPCSYHFAICLWYIAVSASCRTWEKFTWLISANVFSTLTFCFLYLISPQFIMLPYGYFTDFPSIHRFWWGYRKYFRPTYFDIHPKYPSFWKAGIGYFFSFAHGFYPKKIEKRGLKKSNETLWKKVRYCIIFPEKKQGRTIIQNARWWGGDNLSIKRLYFESTLRLAFFRA